MRVATLSPPPVTMRPESVEVAEALRRVKVEVAVVEVAVMEPNCPYPISAYEDWSPVAEAMPPAKVEVAVEVEVMLPVVREPVVMFEKIPEIERKIEAKRLVEVALVERRLVKVEVADDVAVITPVVICPMVELETSSLTKATPVEVAE